MFFSWLDWVLWGRSQRWRALASARSIWLITEVQVDLDLTWPRSCLSACSTESAHFFPFLYCTLRKKPFCLFWVSKKRACVSSSDCLTEFSTSNLLFVVQGTLFSHSVVSHSLQHHRLQHARLPCPSLFPGVCSNSCPLSRWCHPAISSSFPASGSFLMSWLFASGGRSIGASSSVLVLLMNIQGGFPLGLTGLEHHRTIFGPIFTGLVKVKVAQSCPTLQSMEFCRPEYWSG